MVQYSPPPSDLNRLNPIQRYMQKGELDRRDWYRLGALLLLYFIVRPYLQKGAKWLFAPKEGEMQQKAYQQRRAKAKIAANAIRGTETDDLPDLDEEDADIAVATGTHTKSKTDAVNRKGKTLTKKEQEKLLNWDDEPSKKSAHSEKADVMQWLDKWDK